LNSGAGMVSDGGPSDAQDRPEGMPMKIRLIPALSAALAVATLAFAAKITTDYDHQANFADYHTYSWIGVRAGNSLWQDRIQHAVDSALADRGWMKVLSGGQTSVSAFGRTRGQDTLQTFYDGFPGWGWRGWGGGIGTATTEVEPTEVGSLTVDIFDGNTKKLIWRGNSTETLSSNPEKNDKTLDKAVTDMFKKFPPKEKS
jgi:hypothetical protein